MSVILLVDGLHELYAGTAGGGQVIPVMFEDMPAPTLRVYPRYTVVAEKLEAIISLGMANSRMKDYFDLWVILRDAQLEQGILAQAVEAMLNRRGTRRPSGIPIGLSAQFSSDRQKITQWAAFVKRNQLMAVSLEQTVRELRAALTFLFREAHVA
jgi:predicted nucleotidyltransferase component of viral defense system